MQVEAPPDWAWFRPRQYVVVDLEAGTVISRGPVGWNPPTWDTVVGWSSDEQEVVVRRTWGLGPESTGLEDNWELVMATMDGQEHVVWAGHGARGHLTLTERGDAVLFCDGVWTPQPAGDEEEAVYCVELSSAQHATLGRLPPGWRILALCDRTAAGEHERQVLVLGAHFSDSEGGLFLIRQARVQMLPVRVGTGVVRAQFLAGGAALAVLRRGERGKVYELRVLPLAPAGSNPRTVARYRQFPQRLLWAPTGRRLLAWRSCVEGEPVSLVEFPDGKARRVGRAWHGVVAAGWSGNDNEVIIGAEGALWRLDVATSQSRRIMAIPTGQ